MANRNFLVVVISAEDEDKDCQSDLGKPWIAETADKGLMTTSEHNPM